MDKVSAKFGFELSHGYILFSALVNKKRVGRFLLDTGSDGTVITPQLAIDLECKIIGSHQGEVAGGRRANILLTKLSSLNIGGVETSLSLVGIYDLNKSREPYGEIDGIVGADFWLKFPFTIDFSQKCLFMGDEIRTRKFRRRGKVVPVKLSGHSPMVNLKVGGRFNILAKVDTGTALSLIPLPIFKKLGLSPDSPRVEITEMKGLEGPYKVLKAVVDSLSLGEGLEVEGMRVGSYATEIGFLGTDYLHHFRLTLDLNGGELILSKY